MWQKFMQWWIKKPDRYRPAFHNLKQVNEIGALHGEQLSKSGPATFFTISDNHFTDSNNTLGIKEHVLSPR